jgi:choline dehydrogenase-like flavoprotein
MCDVCVIGSGPAGATIARELQSTKLRIVVLEGGGRHREAVMDELNRIENVGAPHRVADQWLVRNRIVGGSSHTWTGRCAPFDEIDFEHRDWVAGSGWPFGLNDLKPYLERSAAYLGLSVGYGFTGEEFWDLKKRAPPQPTLDPHALLPFFWQFAQDPSNIYDFTRFGPRLLEDAGPTLTILTHANVREIHLAEGGQVVSRLELHSLDGVTRNLYAPLVVVAAGGIENARLLLASNNHAQTGIGNANDLVGRYLMDHLRGPVGSFNVAEATSLRQRFGTYNLATAKGRHMFLHGIRLAPEVQGREKLLNCAAFLGEGVTEDDPWNALKRILRRSSTGREDILTVAKNADIFAKGLYDYFVRGNGLPRKIGSLELVCMCEQEPDPASRVTLSETRDSIGMPLARVDWRIHENEVETLRRTGEIIQAELKRIGLPAPKLDDWVVHRGPLPLTFRDVAHPTGTTRMDASPAKGVVDVDCKVHGVDGLYVAGSSVFPTSSHANPTQMVVAMAIRLADVIKRKLEEKNCGATIRSPEHTDGEFAARAV